MMSHSAALHLLRCLLRTENLGLCELLCLRATCKDLRKELTGKLPRHLEYKLTSVSRQEVGGLLQQARADMHRTNLTC